MTNTRKQWTKARKQWTKDHTVDITLRFNNAGDADILAVIESAADANIPVREQLKRLIRIGIYCDEKQLSQPYPPLDEKYRYANYNYTKVYDSIDAWNAPMLKKLVHEDTGVYIEVIYPPPNPVKLRTVPPRAKGYIVWSASKELGYYKAITEAKKIAHKAISEIKNVSKKPAM